MALRTYTVLVPITATSLATQLRALSGWPTMTMAGITQPQPVGRSSQLTLTSDVGNTGNIYIGTNPALSATVGAGAEIIPGGSYNLGSGHEVSVDLSNIYIIATAGAGASKLLVSIVD